MKIGFVTGEFPPMQGGVGAFTKELSDALAALGHEVHVVTDRKARSPEAPRDFWNPRDPHPVGNLQLHPRVNRWWWSAVGAVVDVVLRYDLDIVNLQYQAAAFDMRVPAVNFLPWRLRSLVPTAVTFHDLRHPYLFPKAGPLRDWVVHRLARSAEGVIVTNQEDFDSLLKAGVKTTSMQQIPIGSNVISHVPPSAKVREVRDALGLSPANCLLGYFGFINPSKGPDLLLEALAELDENHHLFFIGGKVGSSDSTNKDYLARIEALIDELNLADRVHWSGYLEGVELSAALQACDMMVMPYRDGVSLRRGTLMACLAHGRPLITTRGPSSAAPLVHGQNVWLSPVDDDRAIRDAIQTLADDRGLRQRLGQGARQVAQQFTWDRIALDTAAFFQELVDRQDDVDYDG